MKADPDDIKVRDVLDLRSQQMLIVNAEYQRGSVWTVPQKKKLVDSHRPPGKHEQMRAFVAFARLESQRRVE